MNLRLIIKSILAITGIVGVVFVLSWALNRDLGKKTQLERSLVPQDELPPAQFAIVKDSLDAITVVLDTGQTVRYLGVRPPESRAMVECFGKEALLINESIIGQKVRLEEDPVLKRSKDGAWVRYVFAQKDPAKVEEEEKRSKEEASRAAATKGDTDMGGDVFPGANPSQSVQPAATVTPEPEYIKYDDYMVNERILEAGFGFPVLSPDMKYYERLTSAVKYGSATKKGLWGACEVSNGDDGSLKTQKIEECVIKGTVIGSGEKIYRVPECPSYADAVVLYYQGGKWFCSVEEATGAEFKRAADCPELENRK